MILEIFNRQKKRGEKKRKNHQIEFYVWLAKKYRMMIKEWYFIFG